MRRLLYIPLVATLFISGCTTAATVSTATPTPWTSKTSGVTASVLDDVQFVNANTGWAVGSSGKIFKYSQ